MGFNWGPFCVLLSTLVGDTISVLLNNGITITGLLSGINDCSYITLATCYGPHIQSTEIVIRDIASVAKC